MERRVERERLRDARRARRDRIDERELERQVRRVEDDERAEPSHHGFGGARRRHELRAAVHDAVRDRIEAVERADRIAEPRAEIRVRAEPLEDAAAVTPRARGVDLERRVLEARRAAVDDEDAHVAGESRSSSARWSAELAERAMLCRSSIEERGDRRRSAQDDVCDPETRDVPRCPRRRLVEP